MSMDSANTYRHWNPERDEQNIAWLHLAMADSRVNLLAGEVLDELGTVLDELAANRPQGIVILSDKQSGFIFGAGGNPRDFPVRRTLGKGRKLRGHDDEFPEGVVDDARHRSGEIVPEVRGYRIQTEEFRVGVDVEDLGVRVGLGEVEAAPGGGETWRTASSMKSRPASSPRALRPR